MRGGPWQAVTEARAIEMGGLSQSVSIQDEMVLFARPDSVLSRISERQLRAALLN